MMKIYRDRIQKSVQFERMKTSNHQPTASEIRCAKQAAQARSITITDAEAEKAVETVRQYLPAGGVNDDQEFWDEMKQYFLN